MKSHVVLFLPEAMHLSSAQSNRTNQPLGLLSNMASSSFFHICISLQSQKDNHVALSLKKTDETQQKHMWLRYFLFTSLSISIYTCIYKHLQILQYLLNVNTEGKKMPHKCHFIIKKYFRVLLRKTVLHFSLCDSYEITFSTRPLQN